jgi:two-component system response regulator RegX3
MGARILIIEDEEPIRRGLCDVLAYHGHTPTGVGDGEAGLEHALSGGYDLLMVDVMLPGMDGFTITERVRAVHPAQAVMLLTARGAESDVLRGFSCGADDYVTKPFSVAQLLARVQALLRRVGGAPRERFTVGPATIDADALVAEVDGATTELTPRDVEVLAYLAERPGCVVSREDLLQQVWGYAKVERVETRCVDMAISKLRRRLATITSVDVIETVRGAGYRAGG